MLSSAVHNCWQTAVRPFLQISLFSKLIPTRSVMPLVGESLCNFVEIHTKKTYRRASFFFPSLSFPSLSGFTRITSLIPPYLWPHSLRLPSVSWSLLFRLSKFELEVPPAVGSPGLQWIGTTCQFLLQQFSLRISNKAWEFDSETRTHEPYNV